MTPSGQSGRQLDVYDVLQEGRLEAPATRDASLVATAATRDGSLPGPRDASRGPTGRICDWCSGPIPADARSDAEVCSVVCRKRRWRFRRAVASGVPARSPSTGHASRRDLDRPARFAYADPPYPGKAGYYTERQEVDHRDLIAQLEQRFPDGWALSTSSEALALVLPMCPASTRVCAWRRRHRPAPSKRPLSAWEPLLVVGGRELPTDRPQEVVDALDYRGRYDSFPDALVGMKPPEFAVWMFAQLGARPGDELVDVFPGSGAIGRAWALYASPADVGSSRAA